MTYPHRCEVNVSSPEEDCGGRVAIVPCGAPAHWFIEQTGLWAHRGGYHACEKHTREALLETGNEVVGLAGGDPIVLDEDGELRVAS